MKTVSIIGNRPQLMKLIPELGDVVLWTGQHYDASLRDAYTKQLERCGEVVDLGAQSIPDMVRNIDRYVEGMMPDILVTVYGDTSSTLAGAMAGSKWVDVVHIEAGLRCGNESLSEERNRIVIDWLSTHLFCPTVGAQDDILFETGKEHPVVGDIMQERLWEFWQTEMGCKLPTNDGSKWICTIHRAENSAPGQMMGLIKNICTYVRRPRIYLHPKGEHLFREWEKIRLPAIESAIPYHEMLRELWNCEGVITDSGGLMREAAWLGKKCIVLRNECEFPELVEANRIKLVGQDEEALRDALESRDWGCKVELENPNTTQKILDHLGIERRFHAEAKQENKLCHASV